jgi:hypothetical protein
MRSALAVALLAVVAAGCGPTRTGTVEPGSGAWRPDEVIDAHNKWAASVQHLWSRASITVSLSKGEKPGDRQTYDVDGNLLVAKPDDLLLRGQVLGTEVFQVGLNADRYWVSLRLDSGGVWTGRRGGGGERYFTLAPTDLMMALGMYSLDLAREDLAYSRFTPKNCAVTELKIVGGRPVPWRRTWFDRQSQRLVRVDLFNDEGRCVLMSELLAFETVDSAPVCSTYRISFYGDSEVDVALRLSAMSLTKNVSPKVFEFRPPPGAKVEDLDAAASDAKRR